MGSRTGALGLVETPQEHDRDGQEPEQKSRFAWASDDVIELEYLPVGVIDVGAIQQ